MEFEWDEAKRQATIIKHEIDFVGASAILDEQNLRSVKVVNGEIRFLAIGLFDGIYVAVIYTFRGEKVRLITARRARDYERRAYCELYD